MKRLFRFKPRRLATQAIDGAQQLLLSAIIAVAVFRLGNMQLDGLLPFAGGGAALLFGFTSLQFNRARAYPAGPTQRRSLVVAELSLRATLSFVLGAALTAVIFAFLAHSSYIPTPAARWPTQWGPILCSLVPLPFVAHSFYTFTMATRVLVHGMFMPIDPRSLANR